MFSAKSDTRCCVTARPTVRRIVDIAALNALACGEAPAHGAAFNAAPCAGGAAHSTQTAHAFRRSLGHARAIAYVHPLRGRLRRRGKINSLVFSIRSYVAVMPRSCNCCCRSSYVRFRCRFVNMRRNWMETNFHSHERQTAQTLILD